MHRSARRLESAVRKGPGQPTDDVGHHQIKKRNVRCQNIGTARPGGHATARWVWPAGAITAASIEAGSGTNVDAVKADPPTEEENNNAKHPRPRPHMISQVGDVLRDPPRLVQLQKDDAQLDPIGG